MKNREDAIIQPALRKFSSLLALAVAVAGVPLAPVANGQSDAQFVVMKCGDPFRNDYGPFDYMSPRNRAEFIPLVEKFHFTRDVEILAGGATSEDLLKDIEHVLRVSPNHHRALNSLAKYLVKVRGKRELLGRQSPHCYFDKAMLFSPNDGTVRMIYGMYLARIGEKEQARERYQQAYELIPQSPEVNYNMGLLLTDLKEYAQANEFAQRAYNLGMPLPGLRNRLQRAGAWNPGLAESADAANPQTP